MADKFFMIISSLSLGITTSVALICLMLVLNIFPKVGSSVNGYGRTSTRIYIYSFFVGIMVANLVEILSVSLNFSYLIFIIYAFFGAFTGFLLSSIIETLDIIHFFVGKIALKALIIGFTVVLALSKFIGALLELL